MNRQTYRVLVETRQQFVIDISARSEAHALSRAERAWNHGEKSRFERVMNLPATEFEIDHVATLHLADIANEDRARWAETALKAYAHETGAGLGRDAVHDLLCDLGHYADEMKLDFRDEVERAAAVWAEEKAEGGAA
jgi:hypothetical protein